MSDFTVQAKARGKIVAAMDGSGLESMDTLPFGEESSYENVDRLKAMRSVQAFGSLQTTRATGVKFCKK